MPTILTLLRIKNLALVEDIEWELDPGFTAITGETGAGKSIIIGALQLLLGERTDKAMIRTGADNCVVEAVFAGKTLGKLNEQLGNAGIEPCENELIIRRNFSVTGVNRQFVNGSPTTLTVLKALGDELVDLHGPHDHQSILSPDRQLTLLDDFAHAHETLRHFERHYRKLQELRDEHAILTNAESARNEEIELLRYQVAEIANAKLSEREEEEIAARYKLAANSKRLIELAGAVVQRLSDSEGSILQQLAETQRFLRELERIDSTQRTLADAHAACVTELSEISRSLTQYAEQHDLDPAQLSALEERLNLFETVKRKYGPSIGEVIACGERATERLKKIEGRDEELGRLAREIAVAELLVNEAGQNLHRLRAEAAKRLSETVRSNLRDLGFQQFEFEVGLSASPEARSTGFDTIELHFSPNPGEPLKPLRAIASSGEISRIMLAIKSALAAQDAIPLLVFDEIDANVGGEIANAVGSKMKNLARKHQVLCITHLPQVAAAASAHFVVTKQVTKGRTHSHLDRVTGKPRVQEIARMLGGRTESALRHASALLAG